MERKYPTHHVIEYTYAEDLWNALSPTRNAGIKQPCQLIYRGQGKAEWGLCPSILRNINDFKFIITSRELSSDEMVITEFFMLQEFVKQCDRSGIRLPNDTQGFRRFMLDFDGLDPFLTSPFTWPNDEILDLMAMAQHHGVPTRLLDWTRLAYISVYFAASSALADHQGWKPDSKLAIWILNTELKNSHKQIRIHKSAGSISPHLAAQYGQFTVHPHTGDRGQAFVTNNLENMLADMPDSPLYKLTLPVFESAMLLKLCEQSGFSASDIYPTADGAGKGVIDRCNSSRAICLWNKDERLMRT